MRGIDRFFLFLYSISFLIVALFTFIVGLDLFDYNFIEEIVNEMQFNSDVKLTIIAISIIIITFSVYFIIKTLHYKQTPSFSNSTSEIGEIRISMDTLENLASKVTMKTRGIKEQRVRVRLEENDLVTVIIKIFVDGETPIPQISEEIQTNVKQHIEEVAGIGVGNVHIVVANVGQSSTKKSRVE